MPSSCRTARLEGAEAVRAAEPRLLRLDDRPREIEHCTNLGVLLDAANQHAEAQATTRRGIALARAEGDRIGELVLLNNLAFSLHDVGRAAAALEPLGEALRLKQTYPELRTSALFVQVQLGNMHRSLGGYAEALEFLQTALSVVGGYSPVFAAGAHNSLAQLYLDLGQPARSQQHLRQSLEVEATPPVIRAISHLLRARSALDRPSAGLAGEALAACGGLHHRVDALCHPRPGGPARRAAAASRMPPIGRRPRWPWKPAGCRWKACA